MDLSDVKEITIPEGTVVKITNASNIILWSAGRIPSEYQEVEYLKADSGYWAYFDLGFSFDKKARVEMSQYVLGRNTISYVFGAAENSGALRCMLTLPYIKAGTLYGSNGNAMKGVEGITYTINDENHYVMTFEKGSLKFENKTTGFVGTSAEQAEYTMTNNLYLFAQNYNGSARVGSSRQIGYFRYYDKDDNLVCDLVPCYRKSDGEIGMYDKVRKIFLTNIGKDSFTKGADV